MVGAQTSAANRLSNLQSHFKSQDHLGAAFTSFLYVPVVRCQHLVLLSLAACTDAFSQVALAPPDAIFQLTASYKAVSGLLAERNSHMALTERLRVAGHAS